MFTLLAAGTGAFWLTIPISVLIVAILGIIVISYRQTIRAYPTGGGSYIVAKENLGTVAGLVAAGALLVDYVLTVSVSVAAGVAALTSAFPEVSGDVRVPLAAALDRRRDGRQPARDPRERHDLRDPDLCLPGLDAGDDRDRDRPLAARRRAPRRRRSCGRRPGRIARPAPVDASLCRRMQRDHRGRGGLERRAGLQAAGSEPRTDNARDHGCARGRDVPWDLLAGRGRRRRAERARDRHLADRASRARLRRRVLRPAALDHGHPGPRRQHLVRRLPATGVAPRA